MTGPVSPAAGFFFPRKHCQPEHGCATIFLAREKHPLWLGHRSGVGCAPGAVLRVVALAFAGAGPTGRNNAGKALV